MPERLCLECGKKLVGRIDKKFCSDACRIANHNRKGYKPQDVVKAVDKILHKNYKILQQLNRNRKTKVSLEELKQHTFDFEHFTSLYRKNEDTIYFYCYDQGYLRLDKNVYLLVVKNSNRIRTIIGMHELIVDEQ